MATKLEQLNRIWDAIPRVEISDPIEKWNDSWLRYSPADFLIRTFHYLDNPAMGRVSKVGHETHSAQLRQYWYCKARDYFLQSQSLGLTSLAERNDFRIELRNGEYVQVKVQDIDGPVDITECSITIENEFEKSICTIAIDRNTGQLVDTMHPMSINCEIKINGDVNTTYNVDFKNGKIATIERTQYMPTYEENLPVIKETTKIDASYLCSLWNTKNT